MDSDREVVIEVIGGNPDIEHYVWLPDRTLLADAMGWCIRRTGDAVSWGLLLTVIEGGYEEVGIGFIDKDTAMVCMLRYGGRYEKKET